MFAPLVAGLSNSKYSPQWDDLTNATAGSGAEKLIICGVSYIVVDVVEWLMMNMLVRKKSRDIANKADYFLVLVKGDIRLTLIMCLWCVFFAAFAYHTRYNHFVKFDLLNTYVTGLSYPAFLDWSEMYDRCYEN